MRTSALLAILCAIGCWSRETESDGRQPAQPPSVEPTEMSELTPEERRTLAVIDAGEWPPLPPELLDRIDSAKRDAGVPQ